MNLNGFGVHDVGEVFVANAEPHQTCDETSPGVVVVVSCNGYLFNILMPFGPLNQKGGLNSNGSSNIGVDQI